MNHIGERGVTCLDGTYSITSHGYPLDVLGNTDIQGVMHPIAFMLTSHEQEIDFDHFYKGLKKLAENLNLEFYSSYIMQDGCRASYNSAKKAFLGVKVLMCFFHVKSNILKHKHLIDDEIYDEFMQDVTKLHMSRNESEYLNNLSTFEDKYSTHHHAMFEYFDKQWIEGVFNNWQIYQNEPGFCNTNSNMESFNATVKRDFTKRFQMSILKTLRILSDLTNYYSKPKNNTFNYTPRSSGHFFTETKLRAERIAKKCFVTKDAKVFYTGANNNFKLRLDDTRCHKKFSCNCSNFIKWAICLHVVAYSNLNDLNFYGAKWKQPEKFVPKMKKGAKSKNGSTQGRHSKASKALSKD